MEKKADPRSEFKVKLVIYMTKFKINGIYSLRNPRGDRNDLNFVTIDGVNSLLGVGDVLLTENGDKISVISIPPLGLNGDERPIDRVVFIADRLPVNSETLTLVER